MGMSNYMLDRPLVAECRTCGGTGEIVFNRHYPADPVNDERKDCNTCKGEGEIQCDTGGSPCPFDGYCYCEAAWERQEEDKYDG